MKITRDTEYRKHLLDTQRERMGVGQRRAGVHVSDLVMCIRKAWAERVTEHVPEISDQTILTWLRGLSHEALLTDGIDQVRAGYCFRCRTRIDYTPEVGDTNKCPVCGDSLLVGTIDWVTLKDEDPEDGGRVLLDYVPVEMKSTLKSSRKSLEDGDMLWFVDQLKSYLFMHDRKAGRIAVLHIMGDYSRSDPNVRSDGPKAELRVYRIEWESKKEAEGWGIELDVSKQIVEGDELPVLDERSPRHPMICEFCIIGEKLPTTGEPCELFPWNEDGVRKGSKLAVKMSMSDMQSELERLEAAIADDNTTVGRDEWLPEEDDEGVVDCD